jgi:DNA-binding NtrC family response regulator
VLVIDDDDAVRVGVRMVLEALGFGVMEADDGRKGILAFQDVAPTVTAVVLDMSMPEMSGEDTFRGLRAVRDDVPVILCSGHDSLDMTRRLCVDGRTTFLQKPFSMRDLDVELKKLLGG